VGPPSGRAQGPPPTGSRDRCPGLPLALLLRPPAAASCRGSPDSVLLDDRFLTFLGPAEVLAVGGTDGDGRRLHHLAVLLVEYRAGTLEIVPETNSDDPLVGMRMRTDLAPAGYLRGRVLDNARRLAVAGNDRRDSCPLTGVHWLSFERAHVGVGDSASSSRRGR